MILIMVVGVLYATGTYLLLQRTLTRIVMGLVLLGHGVNVLLLVSGGQAGQAPLLNGDGDGPFADPLPQAMALTAIVLTFAITSFLLALAYRSWSLTHDDEVEDDVEDRRIATLQEMDEAEREEYAAHDYPSADYDSDDDGDGGHEPTGVDLPPTPTPEDHPHGPDGDAATGPEGGA